MFIPGIFRRGGGIHLPSSPRKCLEQALVRGVVAYVDDDAQFVDVLQLGGEQFPDSLLVVALSLVERRGVAHHIRPARLQAEHRPARPPPPPPWRGTLLLGALMIFRLAIFLVRLPLLVLVVVVGRRQAARRVAGQDVRQLFLLLRRLPPPKPGQTEQTAA